MVDSRKLIWMPGNLFENLLDKIKRRKMTVIEVTKSPPNSKKADPDEAMKDYLPSSNTAPPPGLNPSSGRANWNKKVSFQVTSVHGSPTPEEKLICDQVAEIMNNEVSFEIILKELRKIPNHRIRDADTTVSEIIEACFAIINGQSLTCEDKPKPVQGCSPKPVQTEDDAFPPLGADFRIPMALPNHSEMQSTSSSTEHSDLQQAIQLSLQTQKHEHSFLPPIHENPEASSRTNLAVGLYNVGQSCWFNVIVQELFHIPRYRHLIYTETPEHWLYNNENLTKEAKFLVEIRKIFALLDVGSQKVVNPISALRALEDEYGLPLVGHQNDASEMRDRVIAVITRALRQAAEYRTRIPMEFPLPSSSGDQNMDVTETPSALDELISMTIVERKSDTDDSCPIPKKISVQCTLDRKEILNQFLAKEDVWEESPFRDLFHYKRVKKRVNQEGNAEFEAPTLTDTPTLTCDVQKPSLHDAIENHFTDDKTETYLDNLPEVFFVNLNRFCYRNGQGTSKIHTELKIPQKLYMDRYLHRNYDLVKTNQRTRDCFRHELDEYTSRCNGYDHFPMTSGNAPLLHILESAKLFLSGETAHYRTTETILPTPKQTLPREQHAEFIRTFDNFCNDVARLKNECFSRKDHLQNNLLELFESPELRQEEYNLHSIIIHEGEADRGHYWAYIRCDPNSADKDLWQKFNDSGVETVSWEHVHREAKGNIEFHSGVSAYALCYVKMTSENLLSDASAVLEEKLANLPDDLKEYVIRNNQEFQEEISKLRESFETVAEPLPKRKEILPAIATVFGNVDVIKEPLSYPKESSIFHMPGDEPINKEEWIKSCNTVNHDASFCRLSKYSAAQDWEFNLAQLCALRLRPNIRQLTKYAHIYHEDVCMMMADMHSKQKSDFFDDIILSFYNSFHNPIKEDGYQYLNDWRIDPLCWWFSTGLGMSAFTFRFMCVKSLMSCKIEPLEQIASREFSNRQYEVERESWLEFEAVYARIQSNYSLLKQTFSLCRQIFGDCQAYQKFEEDTVNDYFDHWKRLLTKGHLVNKLYKCLKRDLEAFAQQTNRQIVFTLFSVDKYFVRLALIYPTLKLWRYILYSIMHSRQNPSILNCVVDHFSIISGSLNMIVKWRNKGDLICEKVSESFKTVMSMCIPYFESDSLALTTVENILHSLKNETEINYVDESRCEIHPTSIQHEIENSNRLRIELGFSEDLEDSLLAVSRLLEEANSVFSSDF